MGLFWSSRGNAPILKKKGERELSADAKKTGVQPVERGVRGGKIHLGPAGRTPPKGVGHRIEGKANKGVETSPFPLNLSKKRRRHQRA